MKSQIMNTYVKHSCVTVFFAILVALLYSHAIHRKKLLLVVGILSAPEHFELRDAARKTWLQYIGEDMSYYFLIGNELCNIPVEDRIDQYSCHELPVALPAGGEDSLLYSGTITCYDEIADEPIYSGYTFTTQHDIIIQHMGIINNFDGRRVHVSLMEAATGAKITSATFINDESFNSSKVLWKPVELYKLPKGFEGLVLLETDTKNITIWQNYCGFNWNSSGNILAYNLVLSQSGHFVEFYNNSLASVAIAFKLTGIDHLKRNLGQKEERKKTWNKQVSFIKTRLHEESQRIGDILFLNVVDVYRSLPEKMLLFYKWSLSNEKFSYLLKTDDDTFINIPQVRKELQSLSHTNKELPSHVWWWSVFREGWPVQRFGKWRESAYRSVTYPPFPCGAGYVLSHGAIEFLNRAADKLYTGFQGEDVALGIWLASTNPSSVVNRTSCVWACELPTRNIACNYPQLSAEDMWEIYQKLTDT